MTPAKAEDTLELDEVFTFYALKINPIRIWIALNRRARQIVAFHLGDGSQAACQQFYRKLPYEYYQAHCFADLWRSYACLPAARITQIGKGAGLTNHVERLNNAIRQRFSRMARKTLSFSKQLSMLHLHFKLWAFYYNQACALRYAQPITNTTFLGFDLHRIGILLIIGFCIACAGPVIALGGPAPQTPASTKGESDSQ